MDLAQHLAGNIVFFNFTLGTPKMNFKLVLSIFFLLVSSSHAVMRTTWEFAVATTSMPILSTTTADDAKKSFMGELYSPLGFKYNFSRVSIQLMTSKISLISNKDKDKGLTTTLTQLEGDYYFSSHSNLQFKSQLGIMLYEMKGSGGKTELRNGTSTLSFDLPSRTVNSQMLYFGVGTQYNFGAVNLSADLNVLSLFSSTRRNFFMSVLLGVPL
jgi:hypothetical protein